MSKTQRASAALSAIALGLISVLAFAPYRWFFVMPLALAALFWLVDNVRARRAWWLGWLFGAGQFGFGTYWIYISVHLIGHVPIGLSLLMLALLVAIMAVFSATALAMAVHLTRARSLTRYAIALPACWVFLEWVRSWFLTGFSWLGIGYSQTLAPLGGLAPVLGVFATALTTAISAGLLAWMTLKWRAAPRSWRQPTAAGVAIIAIWALGAGLQQISWTRPAGDAFTVSLIQGNVAQSTKWDPRIIRQSMAHYRKQTLTHLNSRLIVWPETAIPTLLRYIRNDYLSPLVQTVTQHNGALALGTVTQRDKRYYNTVVLLDGHQPQFYNKHHLVPFGEYTPIPDWAKHWLDEMKLPYSNFTPGRRHQKPIQLGRWTLAFVICYEDAFGREIIRHLPQANILIEVSDDAWFGDSIALAQHLQMAQMRAIEAGRYMLRATNTGITAIINAQGHITERLPIDTTAVLTGQVTPYQDATPYARFGNAPLISVLALTLIGLAIKQQRSQLTS